MVLNLHKSFLINLAAFFCMIPYVAPFPVETDIQYPVIVFCGLIFLIDVFKKRIRFNNFELYFLLLAILSLFYINPFNDFQYLIPKRVALFSAFLIFFVFSRYWIFINPKYLLAGVLINFSASILQLFNPDLFEYFSAFIGRAFTMSGLSFNDGSGWRGLTGLSSEPAYLGGLSLVYFFVGYILWCERRISKKIFLVFSTIAIMLNILSLSGTSAVMLFFVIFSLIIFSKIAFHYKLFCFLGFLFTLLLLIYSFGGFSITGAGESTPFRSFSVFHLVLHPFDFISKDYSASLRAMSIVVGVESMIQGNIFGNGIGTLGFVATDIMEGSSIKNLFVSSIMADGREKESFSALGLYLTELGLLFIILLVWLYSRPLKSHYTKIVRIPIFLFILSAFSIMFPPFWMLMAVTEKRVDFYKNQFS